MHLGIDPYRDAPAVLAQHGQAHVLSAVDPFWRHTTAPYGPLFLWIVSGLHRDEPGRRRAADQGGRAGRARPARGVRAAARARARRRSRPRHLVGAAQPARAARVGGGGAQRSFDDWSAGRRRLHSPSSASCCWASRCAPWRRRSSCRRRRRFRSSSWSRPTAERWVTRRARRRRRGRSRSAWSAGSGFGWISTVGVLDARARCAWRSRRPPRSAGRWRRSCRSERAVARVGARRGRVRLSASCSGWCCCGGRGARRWSATWGSR